MSFGWDKCVWCISTPALIGERVDVGIGERSDGGVGARVNGGIGARGGKRIDGNVNGGMRQ